jgi:competence protein ComEC
LKQLLKLATLFLTLLLLLSACDILPTDLTTNNDSPTNQASSYETPITTNGHSITTPTATTASTPGLIVYFIDVGQSDATLIVSGDAAMLIDGGNPSDSSLIYSFLRNHSITHLNYIVASHAHADHVGGLSGALNFATVGVALSPVTEFDTRAFESFVRHLSEQGISKAVPNHGDSFMLGSAFVQIVGPINESNDPNNMSIVMRVTYGETSFLFTGDAERALEQDILDAGYDISAVVLKVGHHGSDTSTTYPFLREIMPTYAVISCGNNNQYGHPHDNLLSRLRDADVTLFRTDLQGTIIAVSDGRTVSFTTERNENTQTNPTSPTVNEQYYIGNVNSLRFHRPSCSSLPAEHNRIIHETREDAISEGYQPCGTCRP